jgi:hypothetical protein
MDIGRSSLDAGALTAQAIRGWFSKFLEVFAVSLVFSIPIFILNGMIVAQIVDESDDSVGSIDFQGTLLASFVSILLVGILTAALTYVFVKVFREEPFTVGGALQFVAAKIGPIAVFTIVTSILIVLGLIALIIPGFLLIIIFSLGMPALIEEELTGMDAIRRSFRIISGNWGVALAVVLIGLIITIVVSALLGGLSIPGSGSLDPPDLTNLDITEVIIQIIASAAVSPLVPALATALYYEAKGRDDGFPSLVDKPDLSDGNLFR